MTPLLQRYFGNWQAPSEPPPHLQFPAPPPRTATRLVLMNVPGATNSIVYVGSLNPHFSDTDTVSMWLSSVMLGAGSQSRLQPLRSQYGAQELEADAEESAQGTLFMVRGAVPTEQTTAFIQRLNQELVGFRSTRPPTQAELQFAQNYEESLMLATFASSRNVADGFTSALIHGHSYEYVLGLAGQFQAARLQRVRAFVPRLLDPARLTWIIAGNLEQIEGPIRELHLGTLMVLDRHRQPVH